MEEPPGNFHAEVKAGAERGGFTDCQTPCTNTAEQETKEGGTYDR